MIIRHFDIYLRETKFMTKLFTAEEQILHMKEKGITFTNTSEDDARLYLETNNNYFKLKAFRKGFYKHETGPNTGKYIKLDFGYLVDLSIIDMRFRYILLHLALDIEHYAKIKLLRRAAEANLDGFSVLAEFKKDQPGRYSIAEEDINRSRKSAYCGDLVRKYESHMPIWAFIEVVSFGSFMTLYKFIADKLSDKDMQDDFYLLLSVKNLRNACAHNSCILNDLKPVTPDNQANKLTGNYQLNRELKKLGLSASSRKKKMSNPRIFDTITTLYAHKKIVTSQGVKERASKELDSLLNRMFHHIEYYSLNETIGTSFDFMKTAIQSWFPVV